MKQIQSYSQHNKKDNFEELLMLSLYETLSIEDKIHLQRFHVRKYLVNEGIISTLTTKGKEILKKIVDRCSDITNLLSHIKNELKVNLSKVLKEGSVNIKNKLAGDKNFILAVKKHISADKNAFLHDVKTCHEVSVFYTTQFTESIIERVMVALKNLFVHRKHNIHESLDINILDKLISHIHKIPPFAWLDMLHHKGTHGAEHIVNGLSYITQHLGGPGFKLPVISSLLGLAFEWNIKGLVKHGLIHAAEIFTIPFVGLIVKTAGNIATFLACYELCKEISSNTERYHQYYNHD